MEPNKSNVAFRNLSPIEMTPHIQSYKEFSEAHDITGTNTARNNPIHNRNKPMFMRLPSKTQLLLERSNFHQIKKYEKLLKQEPDMATKNKSSIKVTETSEGDTTPFMLPTGESEALLPVMSSEQ